MDTDDVVEALERVAVGAVSLTTRALEEAATGFDLTFPQWRALIVLGDSDAGARVGAVASRVGCTQPATGRLLRRLERRGFVAMATDDTDHRATRARLTKEGRALRARILASRRAGLRRIVAAIDPADLARSGPLVEALGREFGRLA